MHVRAVIPGLNEEGAIGPTLRSLPRNCIDRVLVVDGGSRDRTVEEASAAGARLLLRCGLAADLRGAAALPLPGSRPVANP